MQRSGIKLSLLLVALGSAVYWARPPYLLGGPMFMIWCLLWALLALAGFRFERAEDWTYRVGSFLTVALATIEAAAGLAGLQTRAGLLPMALLHGLTFLLVVTGRFRKVSSSRTRLT